MGINNDPQDDNYDSDNVEKATIEGEWREADAEAEASSEPTDAAVEASDKPAAKPKKSKAKFFLLLILLLLLAGLAAGGFFGYQKAQQWLADFTGQTSQQTQQQQQMAQQSQALSQQLQETNGNLAGLEANAKKITTLQQQQAQQIQTLSEQLEASQRQVAEWQARIGQQQEGWQLAEAEWLLWVGNMRLQMQDNYQGATTALEQADAMLSRVNHPRLNPVRAQIAEDLLSLKTADRPDINSIALGLLALSNQANELPLPARPKPFGESLPASAATTQDNSSTAPAWKQALAKAWDEIRGLVTIRRQEKNLRPWLSEQEEQMVYQSLQTRLDAARLAALRGEGSLYQQSIRSAQTWLLTWFDASSNTVEAVNAELDSLAQQRLEVTPPDISKSLTLIRDLRKQGL